MSSVRRRAWLLEARGGVVRSKFTNALGRFLDNCEGKDKAHLLLDFKTFIRTMFSSVRRPPLKFKSEQQGRDILGGSLVTVQLKNRPPLFNPLLDNLAPFMTQAEECWLRSDYWRHLERANRIFDAAVRMLRDSLESSDKPLLLLRMQRAARSINGVRRSIFQYEDRFPSVLHSARRFWPECKAIGDSEVLALMAADQAHAATDILLQLMQSFEREAAEKGIARSDNRRISKLRAEMSERERQESWYGFDKLRRADELLHLSQLAELATDSELARSRFEEREREFMRREAEAKPMAETGKKFVEGRKKGGAARAGKTYSPIKLAVRSLCAALATYDPEKVFCEVRRDCEDDGYGGSCSEVMDELRGATEAPVLLRFQQVPDNLSNPKANICYVITRTGEEKKVTVGKFRNDVGWAKKIDQTKLFNK